MQKIIKDGVIVDNDLVWIRDVKELASQEQTKAMVPLTHWLSDECADNTSAIWLNSDENTDVLAGKDLSNLQVIGINFPAFVDGRGFTYARLLRERYKFTGEIRALGHFIPDQLGYLLRIGFNAFQFEEAVNLENALKLHHPISAKYQGDVADPRPIFLRRAL